MRISLDEIWNELLLKLKGIVLRIERSKPPEFFCNESRRKVKKSGKLTGRSEPSHVSDNAIKSQFWYRDFSESILFVREWQFHCNILSGECPAKLFWFQNHDKKNEQELFELIKIRFNEL